MTLTAAGLLAAAPGFAQDGTATPEPAPAHEAPDADVAIDEAPVELPSAALAQETAPEDEDLTLPSTEMMVKFPTFVTALSKTTLTLQNPQHRNRMDKWMPETFLGLLFIGRIHKMLGLTAAIFGLATPQTLQLPEISTGRFLDFLAVLQLEPAAYFNVWVGHVTVPSDRSSLSSPFFMAAWRYPGEMTPGAFPVAPKTGTFSGISASNGPTVWGEFAGGVFKYYAGAYLQDPEGTPVYSARVNLALINPEPGFLHNSGYYGKKGDMLAIGASVQYQALGSNRHVSDDVTLRANYLGGNVDLLFEKKLGQAVWNVEAAAHYYGGEYERVDYSAFALTSLLMPFRLGIGRPQLLVRYQAFHQKAGVGQAAALYHVFDAQLSYVIKRDFIKGAIGFTRHQNVEAESSGNALYLGLQLSK